jgi:hypothetical protein
MHTGGTPENPLCIRCTSGVPPVYTCWEPLLPGGFAEGLQGNRESPLRKWFKNRRLGAIPRLPSLFFLGISGVGRRGPGTVQSAEGRRGGRGGNAGLHGAEKSVPFLDFWARLAAGLGAAAGAFIAFRSERRAVS